MLEADSALGFIVAHTERALLHTLVTGVIYREPALLAKAVTTSPQSARSRSAAAASSSRARSPSRRPASCSPTGRPRAGTGIDTAGWPVRLYGPVKRPSALSSPTPNGGSCSGAQ